MPLDQLRRELERKAAVTGRNTAREAEHRLKRNSPISSGRMQSATRATSKATPRGATIDIIVDTDYAHIVSGGQRPHSIGAAGQWLENTDTGFQARGPVQHPGAQPNSWWTDTIRELPDMLARNWRGA